MGGSIQYDPRMRRYFIAVYWDGKQHKVWADPNTGEKFYHEKQAQKNLGRLQTEIDEGTFNPRFWKPDSPLVVSEYFKEWIALIEVSKTTRQDYASYFKNHIIPKIGGMDIRHIRNKHLVALHKDMPLSDKGKYNVLGALKTMLRWAWRNEDIKDVPPFPVLSFEPPEIAYLALDQQEFVLSHIPESDRPIFEIGMEYGLRTQEVRALQKDCVLGGSLVIKRAFAQNTLIQHTKTKQIRRFRITEHAKNILDQMPMQLSPFVFVREDGKPYTNKNLNSIWRKACASAGISIKLQNAFRHSLGCQLLGIGESMDTVQDVLGHTTPGMTRRYAERSSDVISDALERRRNVVKLRKKGLVPN